MISCCVGVSKLKTSPGTTDYFIGKEYFVFGVLHVAAPMDLHLYKQYKNVYHSFTYIYNLQIYMQSLIMTIVGGGGL